ncbi:DUF3558 domain-containing protein [Streptomyces sp. 900116325]
MRRSLAAGSVALLIAAAFVAGVTGCSAGGDTETEATDAKVGGSTASPAPPGRYHTLLKPCRSVERGTLKDLLPGVLTLPEDQQQEVLRGTASPTFDTDRRAACSWMSQVPDASQLLRVDFERVVSYDPVVSDESKAQEVFTKKKSAATGSLGGAPSTSGATGLEPRVVNDLGDAAYIDDVLARARSTAQRRTVSVVFRVSNVIVTIDYTEQPARVTKVPDSKELQEKAQSLARKLAELFDE